MVRRRNKLFFFHPWKITVFLWWGLCVCRAELPAQTELFSPELERKVPVLTAQEHPWTRFLPGSWVRTQTVTITDYQGRKVLNVSETKTILESVDKDSLTLKSISMVNVGGRSVEKPPETETLDFYSERVIEGTTIEQRPSTTLTVDKQLIPCEVRSYVLLTEETKQRTTVWYSTQIHPYILRVERVLTTAATDKNPEERILSSSTTELRETDALRPLRLRRSREGKYTYQTITKTGDMTTETVTKGSRLITGGLDNQIVREFDRDGKVIRTTETRMINYYALESRW